MRLDINTTLIIGGELGIAPYGRLSKVAHVLHEATMKTERY